jgi:hypothetical protein
MLSDDSTIFMVLPFASIECTAPITARLTELWQTTVIDINQDIHLRLNDCNYQQDVVDFFKYETVTEQSLVFFEDVFIKTVEQANRLQTTKIVFYLPNSSSQYFTKWLSYHFRKISVDIELSICGPGCSVDNNTDFIKYITDIGFVKHFVSGDLTEAPAAHA